MSELLERHCQKEIHANETEADTVKDLNLQGFQMCGKRYDYSMGTRHIRGTAWKSNDTLILNKSNDGVYLMSKICIS